MFWRNVLPPYSGKKSSSTTYKRLHGVTTQKTTFHKIILTCLYLIHVRLQDNMLERLQMQLQSGPRLHGSTCMYNNNYAVLQSYNKHASAKDKAECKIPYSL
jgi:hypothetical protein